MTNKERLQEIRRKLNESSEMRRKIYLGASQQLQEMETIAFRGLNSRFPATTKDCLRAINARLLILRTTFDLLGEE